MTATLPRSSEPTAHLDRILGLSPSAMTLGLGNILALLERLDHPEKKMKTVVVAGTNGKGSVVAMLAAILRSEGMRVGRFISPHVYAPTERVWIDGDCVSSAEMERAAERVASLLGELSFSYFEAITAIAFLLFAERKVEIAVLETGLGGRFDATNVTQPEATVITSISLDHRRILGSTTGEIVREKLGITRAGVPLFHADMDAGLESVIDEKARRDGFEAHAARRLGRTDVVSDAAEGMVVDIKTERATYDHVPLPFPGEHQRTNTVLAVAAAEQVLGRPLAHLDAALRETYLPGRFERFDVDGKRFFLDVAHNDAALTASAQRLLAVSPREQNAVVFGLMRRKELEGFPDVLLRSAARVYLVSPGDAGDGEAWTPAELLGAYFGDRLASRAADVILWPGGEGSWDRLLDTLVRSDSPFRTVLAMGSHHVVEHFGRCVSARKAAD